MSARKAFTLVEVMVGTAIAAIGILSVCAGIFYGFGVTDASRKSLRATQVMLETFEVIRLYNWDQINSPSNFIPSHVFATYTADINRQSLWWDASMAGTNTPDFFGTVTKTPAQIGTSYSSNLLVITVELRWESEGVTNIQTMNTFVSQYGMQDYDY